MRLRTLQSLLWLAPLLSVSCNYTLPTTAVRGYEENDRTCRDGVDNDADGLVDCEDPDCFYASVHCGQDTPETGLTFPENTVERCHDSIDNDNDGQYDCADKDCQGLLEACCSYEFTNAACSNGVDDDQNGRTDCDDWSCAKGLFVTVCTGGSNTACAETGPEESLEACSDGCDNDENGYVDCNDFSCSRSENPQVVQFCDQQGNTGSSASFALTGEGEPEDTAIACQDGIDNDGNGHIDCADWSCSRNADPEIAALCPSEETAAACSDGIDNDGNGFTDCADYSCSQHVDPVVRQVCQESLYAPADWQSASDDEVARMALAVRTFCSDGQDNDGDGFADCDDFDCSWNPLALDESGAHLCSGKRVCE